MIWPVSLPFYILQLVKSLVFHIPKAWKRYCFRAEPPRILSVESRRGHETKHVPIGCQTWSILPPNIWSLTAVKANHLAKGKGTEKRATKSVQLVLQHYCKTTLVIKRATSLFNSFCSNVARQVARFLLPVFPYLKFWSARSAHISFFST